MNGKTVRDRIVESKKKRLEKLIEINAPAVIIDNLKKEINGNIKIGGDIGLLDVVIITWEEKKGRMWKLYYLINNEIQFFPNAQYGMFISRSNGNEVMK